jgi:hypothetical protein
VTTLTGANQVSLSDDTIADNAVYGIGGGAAFTLAPGHYSSVPTALVQSSTFVGNTARSGQQPCHATGLGGGIANGAGSGLAPVALKVDNSFIAGNTATEGPDFFGPAIGGYTTVGDGSGSTGWGSTDTVYAIVEFTPLSQFGGQLPTVEVVSPLTGDPAQVRTIGEDDVVRGLTGTAFPPGADGAYGTASSSTITAGSTKPCNPGGGTGTPTGGTGTPTGGTGTPTGGTGTPTGGTGTPTGGTGTPTGGTGTPTGGTGTPTGGTGTPTGGTGTPTGGTGTPTAGTGSPTGGTGTPTGGTGSSTGTNTPPNTVPVHHKPVVHHAPVVHHKPVVHHVPVVHHKPVTAPIVHHKPTCHTPAHHVPAGPLHHARRQYAAAG